MIASDSRNLIGDKETVYKRRSLPGKVTGLPTDHSLFSEGMQHPGSIGEIHKHQRGFPNRTGRPSGKEKSGLGQNPNDKTGKFRRGGGQRSFWFRVVCLTGGFSLLLLAFRRKSVPPPRGSIMKGHPEAPEYEWTAAMDIKPYTLGELLELTPNTPGVADVTAILTDSPSLEVQLHALLYSSVAIAEVWVAMPAKTAFGRRDVTEIFRRKFRGRLHLVKSDLFSSLAAEDGGRGESLGGGDGSFFDETFGRFQLAMQAHTSYVWVINPDVVPGHKFLELLWRVSDSSEITGALGGDGAVMSAVPNGEWRATVNDGRDPDPDLDLKEMGVAGREDTHRALALTPVDVLFSQWFLHRDLVRLVFREKLAFSRDGGAAAMTLSYSLRRFAGIQSYVLPLDTDLPDYVANVSPSERAALSTAAAASLAESMGRKSFPRQSTSDVSLVSGQSVIPSQSNLLRGAEGRGGRVERGGGAEEDGGLEQHRWPVNLPSKSQFRELMARGGRFLSTPSQCPSELVVLVVDGRRQAELLGPLYRGLVASAEGVGAEVFVVVIEAPEGREKEEEEERWDSGERRQAPTECTEVARALGVSPKVTVAKAAVGINPAAETPVEGSDGPKTQRLDEFNDRLGGYLGDGGGGDGRMKPDPANWGPLDWARRGLFLHKGGGASMEEGRNSFPHSHHFLTPEEFCLGDAFGVFHIRVGQDYPRIAERKVDPFLEVFYGLAEVLDLVKPKIVAYVDSSSYAVAKVLPPGMSSTAQQGFRPEDVVVRAIEAAVRSSGGGHNAPTRPIGVALPDSDLGAASARAMAYLPRGSLERWKKPEIVLVLVHQRRDSASLLALTLESLAGAHYLGDHVELRVVLHAGAAGDAEIESILRRVDWRWGQKDVTYFHDGSGRAGSPELPGGLAALQAFPTPDWHGHVIPLFSGGRLDPYFYVWLKVALMNEGYSSRPVQGLPFGTKEKQRVFPGGWGGAKDHVNDEDIDEYHGHDDEKLRWGKFLALSVDIPSGLCPGGDDCSRVWMYGNVAWGALIERCRLAAASTPPPGVVSAEALDVACAVGNRAKRTGDVWGIRASHVCGAGPPEKIPVVYPERLEGWKAEAATRWQSAKVWTVRGLGDAAETFA